MKKALLSTKALLTLLLFLCCSLPVQAASPALSPAEALAFMKKTPDLVIVDVATKDWYAKEHFTGAISIPIENISSAEAEKLYRSLPAGRPVLLHCRLGMIVPSACRTLKALRPDIPQIMYIDGRPLFDEYNAWYQDTHK